ncbi:MAG TPA: DedA family protein [Usitatibacteraceae bacterium]|nr:DedA family protein [Usitatibacteraceae bacterium]
MELLAFFWDLLVHLDRHLGELVAQFGPWVYAILFAIIFCETGLVVTPFLPGDSLLFVAGGLAALGGMNVHLLVVLLVAAAILGDAVNYAVGRYLGRHLFTDRASRFLNPRHLERAHAFYERHGGKAIVIARFVPIVRTYVPFVAGMAEMSYPRFAFYNVAGALLWVVSLCYAGYFFGNLPFVRQNLTLIIFGIIGVSLLPIVWAAVRARLEARA